MLRVSRAVATFSKMRQGVDRTPESAARGVEQRKRPVLSVRLQSTVNLLVENLVKLQSVELERAQAAQTARALPAQVTQAEAALSQAQNNAASISDGLTREETIRSHLQRDIAHPRPLTPRLRA